MLTAKSTSLLLNDTSSITYNLIKPIGSYLVVNVKLLVQLPVK